MSHDYRDVLLKAASRVEQEGMWCQWRLKDSTGAYCAMGHIFVMEEELDFDPDEGSGAFEALLNVIGGESVAGWNDTPGRTAFEVAEAMRKAAE